MQTYFIRTGEHTFTPTPLTGGAWVDTEQHIAPMAGLITHEVERFVAASPLGDMLIGRISLDILGPLTMDDFELHVERVRGGRTIDLLEAVVVSRERPTVRARVWRMARVDTASVAGDAADALPAPDALPRTPFDADWVGEFIRTVDLRYATPPRPGRAQAWVTTEVAVVDEPTSDLVHYIGLVDVENGIAVRESPQDWLFPNLDLTIHLFRQPVGRWVGLDTTVTFGPTGQGLTATVLHDETGPVGRASQILTVRPAR